MPTDKPDNNLILAIVSTLCCGCLPVGIVAIVYAASVDGAWARGEHAEARRLATAARNWSIASFVIGIGAGVAAIVSSVAVLVVGNNLSNMFDDVASHL